MRKFSLLILLALLPLTLSCGDTDPTDPLEAGGASDMISDAQQNHGNSAFFWLAPIVKDNTYSGVFNAQLKPWVVICKLDTSTSPACDPAADTLAQWTMSTGLQLSTTDEHYGFEWHTDQTATDFDATYRIQVYLTERGETLLGFADVQFFSNGQELKELNTGAVIELRDGRTLPGRFRIEKGASCNGEADCGEALIGPGGGTVTTEAGFAGVELPAGAVDGDILIKIRRIDPSQQDWERCLPTGLRQEEGCYEFDTEPAIQEVNRDTVGEPYDFFHELVTVGVCIDPEAARREQLTLHKYDPDKPANGVVELPGAFEDFLTCDNFAFGEPGGFLGRLASAAQRLVRPVTSLITVRDLHASDEGRGGVTDAFSFIGWAEPVDLTVATAPPTAVLPTTAVPTSVHALTAHGHHDPAPDASGHTLRFSYTDPAGTEAILLADTTSDSGLTSPAWTLTDTIGIHTVTVTTQMEITLNNESFLVPDPTSPLVITVGGYESAEACAGTTDCGQAIVDAQGDTVVTENGFAGVDIPAGALDEPVLITIRRVDDPSGQPWGRCLPTGLRQEEGCYEFDTEPALSAVQASQEDKFNTDVVVAVCLDTNAARKGQLTLHKYDPDHPTAGVVELAGATGGFVDCTNFATLPNGLFERLAHSGRRLLSPVVNQLAPRPLYASDEGRGGVTDAFSFIGWAEPVTLDLTTEPNVQDSAVTDVVITAEAAHNHGGTPIPADGATIRFEYTDPSGAVTVSEAPTTINGSAAEARISLTTQGGTHNVRASTQQEILIDSDLIISGGATGMGMFASPTISFAGTPTAFLVPDPTAAAESGDLTVFGLVSRWDADDVGDPFADRIGPNHGNVTGTVDGTAAGIDGSGFLFDGKGGVMAAPAQHIGAAEHFTVAAWVKLDPAGSPWDIQRFVSLGGNQGEKGVLRQEEGPSALARQAHFYGGFGSDDGTGSSLVHIREHNALRAGCWEHVAGTYDGEQIAFYLDGVQIATQPVPLEDRAATRVADHVTFGSDVEPLRGTLDEVEVHNHALSVDEIKDLANQFRVACEVTTGSAGGFVTDASSGEPLSGVNVLLMELERGTVTDLAGRYRILDVAPGTYTIRASMIGYEADEKLVEVTSAGFAGMDFALQPVAGTPDLVIEQLSHAPGAPTTDSTVTFTAVVKNVGTATAGPSGVATEVHTAFGRTVFTFSHPVPALEPGETFTSEGSTSPHEGDFTYTAVVDGAGEVAESDETNNTATGSVTVGPSVITFEIYPDGRSVAELPLPADASTAFREWGVLFSFLQHTTQEMSTPTLCNWSRWAPADDAVHHAVTFHATTDCEPGTFQSGTLSMDFPALADTVQFKLYRNQATIYELGAFDENGNALRITESDEVLYTSQNGSPFKVTTVTVMSAAADQRIKGITARSDSGLADQFHGILFIEDLIIRGGGDGSP